MTNGFLLPTLSDRYPKINFPIAAVASAIPSIKPMTGVETFKTAVKKIGTIG